MNACTLTSKAVEMTEAWGACLGRALRPGDLVRLSGELGAGKTTFCRGVGQGMGIDEPLASPTYLLCKEYPTPDGPLLHLDGYFDHRLASLLGEGLIERIDGRSIVLVEWAERVEPWLPEGGLSLRFQRLLEGPLPVDPDEDQVPRQIEAEAVGLAAEALLARFVAELGEIGISVEPRCGPTR